MKLLVVRDMFSTKFTLGKLYIDGIYFCETCEDADRYIENPVNKKIKGETAIQPGVYELTIDNSARFGRQMPHILNVPQFEGVRIHSGNTAEDTEGCLLIGKVRGADRVLESRDAFMKFWNLIYPAFQRKEKMEITYQRAEA